MVVVPKLVRIDPARLVMTRQGQPMIPLVSADVDGSQSTLLSAGVVSMDGEHAAHAHLHQDTDVIVLLWQSGAGGALTLFGDRLQHEIWQLPHEALWIPHGVPHAAINPSATARITAFEFRSNPVLGEDNHLLPELEHVVQKRRAALHRRGTSERTGADHRDADIARWAL